MNVSERHLQAALRSDGERQGAPKTGQGTWKTNQKMPLYLQTPRAGLGKAPLDLEAQSDVRGAEEAVFGHITLYGTHDAHSGRRARLEVPSELIDVLDDICIAIEYANVLTGFVIIVCSCFIAMNALAC